MSDAMIFILGILVVPVGLGLFAAVTWLRSRAEAFLTARFDLDNKTMTSRRSIIFGTVNELLDARYVRGVRLPFGYMFVIRSSVKTEFATKFLRDQWAVVTPDYDNVSAAVGDALDILGYEAPESDRDA